MKNCLLLLLLTMASCRNCDQVLVPYTEQEPYEAIEDVEQTLQCYVSSATYNRESGATLLDIKPKLKCTTVITNTDKSSGGVFRLVEKYRTTLDEELVIETSNYLNPGETKTFEAERELDHYVQVRSEGYHIEAPTVIVSKRVTKYRDVTKYRPCNPCKETCN